MNKGDFESNIILNRLFQLLYIEKGKHSDPDPTIPGAKYGQSTAILVFFFKSGPVCSKMYRSRPKSGNLDLRRNCPLLSLSGKFHFTFSGRIN